MPALMQLRARTPRYYDREKSRMIGNVAETLAGFLTVPELKQLAEALNAQAEMTPEKSAKGRPKNYGHASEGAPLKLFDPEGTLRTVLGI